MTPQEIWDAVWGKQGHRLMHGGDVSNAAIAAADGGPPSAQLWYIEWGEADKYTLAPRTFEPGEELTQLEEIKGAVAAGYDLQYRTIDRKWLESISAATEKWDEVADMLSYGTKYRILEVPEPTAPEIEYEDKPIEIEGDISFTAQRDCTITGHIKEGQTISVTSMASERLPESQNTIVIDEPTLQRTLIDEVREEQRKRVFTPGEELTTLEELRAASAAGHVIEYKHTYMEEWELSQNCADGDIRDIMAENINDGTRYRIMPPPEFIPPEQKDVASAWRGALLVPWTQEDAMSLMGKALIRRCVTGNKQVWLLDSCCENRVASCLYESAVHDLEHSLDGGKTWHPCGKVKA